MSGGGGAASVSGKYDEAKLKTLEADLAKSPDKAELKAEVAEANYEVGYVMMTNPDLPPRVKYRGALKLFRRTLELKPDHQQATASKNEIERIYTSMGRPIPE